MGKVTSIMNYKRLDRNFYIRDSISLAKDLLGKVLVFKGGRYRIVEVEAYCGITDKGAHTYNNRRTKRTEVMYLEGGHTYIYLIYGMYYNLNIVASIKDDPQAVLIRAVEPLDFVEETLSTNGPGKLCRKLRIDKTYYGIDLCSSDIMYICDEGFNDFEVIESKRINIPYAEEYQDKLWRFYIKNNKYVSRK